MLISEADLLASVGRVVAPFGCRAVSIGSYATRKEKYGHVFGPSVKLVSHRGRLSAEDVAAITAEVLEKVNGITGVMFENARLRAARVPPSDQA